MLRKILIIFIVLFPFVSYAEVTLDPSTIMKDINAERSSAGLSLLSENTILSNAAQSKAREIAGKQALIHSTGIIWQTLERAGYMYQYAGENLAVNSWPESQLIKDWMDSPSHRKNILNSQFQDIGVGVVRGAYMGQDTTYAVAYFAVPKTQSTVLGISVQNSESETIKEKKIAIIKQLLVLLTEYLRIINETHI